MKVDVSDQENLEHYRKKKASWTKSSAQETLQLETLQLQDQVRDKVVQLGLFVY